MANSRRKCSRCGCHRPLADLVVSGIQARCAEPCTTDVPREAKQRRPAPKRRPSAVDVEWAEMRAEVLSRDGHRCAWCGNGRSLHVHHVHYRSEGAAGASVVWNLVTLCEACHSRAHSNKRRYQPLLLAYLWLLYTYAWRPLAELEAEYAQHE